MKTKSEALRVRVLSPSIQLDALSPEQKRRLWHYWQQRHPALVALMKDPQLAHIRSSFQARWLVARQYLPSLPVKPVPDEDGL